jgi:hypothetical protein
MNTTVRTARRDLEDAEAALNAARRAGVPAEVAEDLAADVADAQRAFNEACAGNPMAGLVEAFDAEAARVRDRSAPQSHAAHGACPGGLMRDRAGSAGPDAVCWEHQAGELPIRLSFSIKVF